MNTADSSPVKVHLLKKHCRPVIYSSDEDVTREAEVASKENTPSGSSQLDSFSTGSSLQTGEQASIIIDMTHLEGCDSPWNSDEDEQGSETSTPAYKRGRYDNTPDKKGDVKTLENPNQRQDEEDRVTVEAIRVIQREGVHFTVPGWIQKRKVSPSILILADAQLKYWPPHDSVCEVIFHQNWPLRRWSQAVRLGTIGVKCVTVVLYLEGTTRWSDIPPIKNVLQALCKTIRNHGSNPRIFVANHLPRVRSDPLRKDKITQSNYTLGHATRSVCRAMGGSSNWLYLSTSQVKTRTR